MEIILKFLLHSAAFLICSFSWQPNPLPQSRRASLPLSTPPVPRIGSRACIIRSSAASSVPATRKPSVASAVRFATVSAPWAFPSSSRSRNREGGAAHASPSQTLSCTPTISTPISRLRFVFYLSHLWQEKNMTDNAFYMGPKVYFTIDGEIRTFTEAKKHLINEGFTQDEAITYLNSLIGNAK